MTAPRLTPGQLVAGKLAIRAALGYGGATATYSAVLQPGRDVALKLLAPQLASRPDVTGMLQQAAAVTNGLPPDVVGLVLESGFDPQTGSPFIVTDFVSTPSLAQTAAAGRLQPSDVSLLLHGIGRAVDAAHARGLAHGALKPTNVFVGSAPLRPVRVVDFGVHFARGALPTNEGWAIAAPWLAPEQLQGGIPGPPVDVFSAALVAFFAATGKSYWRSCQGPMPDIARWQQEVVGPRETPSVRAASLGSNLPPGFDAALGRALASDPRERFGSVGELAAALAQGGAAHLKTVMQSGMDFGATIVDPNPPAGLVPQGGAARPGFGGTLAISPPAEATKARVLGGTLAITSPVQQPMHPQPPMQPAVQPLMSPQPMGPPLQVVAESAGPASAGVVPKSRTGVYVIVAVVGLLVVGGLVGLMLALRHPKPTAASLASATATASQPPPPSSSAAAASPPPAAASVPAAASSEGRGASAPGELATLTIACVPECDSIAIDDDAFDGGVEAGVTDPVELPAGDHTLAVAKATYVAQTRKVTLKAGQKERAIFYLAKPGAQPPPPPPAHSCGKFLERCP